MKSTLDAVKLIQERVYIRLSEKARNSVKLPPAIEKAMKMGAVLVVSVSGGKDSQIMLRRTVNIYRRMGWTGKIVALFCDLGRIEWAGILELIQKECKFLGVGLIITRREKGGMVDLWDERRETIASQGKKAPFWSSATARYCTDREKAQTSNAEIRNIEETLGQIEQIGDRPFWSSSSARFCTSDEKRTPSDKELRQVGDLVVCAIGIRAEESGSRQKKPTFRVRNTVSSEALKSPKDCKEAHELEQWGKYALEQFAADRAGDRKFKRLVFDWHPIHHLTIEDVWEGLGTSVEDLERRRELFRQGHYREALEGFEAHWGYVASISRVSCSHCVLAAIADLKVGAILNPLCWLELVLMELEGGWSFKTDLWLANLRDHVEAMPQPTYKKLYKILQELNLVKKWSSTFSLRLLATCPSECAVFWSDTAFRGILSLIPDIVE